MTETKKPVHEVLVNKANLPMLKNESIGEFTSNLSTAGSEAVRKAAGISSAGYAYMVEAFADKAVFYVSDYSDTKSYQTKKGMPRYYAVTYKRDTDGTFTFDTFKEVVRRTVFEAAPKDALTETTEISASKSLSDAGWDVVPPLFAGVI